MRKRGGPRKIEPEHSDANRNRDQNHIILSCAPYRNPCHDRRRNLNNPIYKFSLNLSRFSSYLLVPFYKCGIYFTPVAEVPDSKNHNDVPGTTEDLAKFCRRNDRKTREKTD
jgi:hypothetical protein